MAEFMAIALFISICLALMSGYPVAFTLGGMALLFAGIGVVTGSFDDVGTCVAEPHLRHHEQPDDAGRATVRLHGRDAGEIQGCRGPAGVDVAPVRHHARGLAISVCVVGALLAGEHRHRRRHRGHYGLLALPTMLRRGYDPAIATGTLAATGTLGQIIPPSIILVLLGDVMSSAFQQAQLKMGIFSPKTVSVGDLFVGALIPAWCWWPVHPLPRRGGDLPAEEAASAAAGRAGADRVGQADRCVAATAGADHRSARPRFRRLRHADRGRRHRRALGATLLSIAKGQLNFAQLKQVAFGTTEITSMVFLILIGASLFSLVFRGFGGEALIEDAPAPLPGGVLGAFLVVMLVIFLLGFILDFIEIIFVVVPIVGPILLAMGLDPVWLGVMFAINLQTSFLTPPFGFVVLPARRHATQRPPA